MMLPLWRKSRQMSWNVFANMAMAVLVLPAKLLELTCGITLVSNFKMGSYPQSDIIEKIYGCKMRNKAAINLH